MPLSYGGTDGGWWYDKRGTGSMADDAFSLSWINVGRQMSYWNTRRTDWVSSISDVARGDFVYYDWTGDGTWDHVAELVGTNSSGQKIIDAHTTDYYHVYWKLGTSATHYRFAHTRPQIYI
jgi:cell wall-associated NlpC family hydrolase